MEPLWSKDQVRHSRDYKPSFESTKVFWVLKQVVRFFFYSGIFWWPIAFGVVFLLKNSSKVFHFVNKNPRILSFYLLHLFLNFCVIDIVWFVFLLIFNWQFFFMNTYSPPSRCFSSRLNCFSNLRALCDSTIIPRYLVYMTLMITNLYKLLFNECETLVITSICMNLYLCDAYLASIWHITMCDIFSCGIGIKFLFCFWFRNML